MLAQYFGHCLRKISCKSWKALMYKIYSSKASSAAFSATRGVFRTVIVGIWGATPKVFGTTPSKLSQMRENALHESLQRFFDLEDHILEE